MLLKLPWGSCPLVASLIGITVPVVLQKSTFDHSLKTGEWKTPQHTSSVFLRLWQQRCCVSSLFGFDSNSGVTRLDGARGKKQVWRPHVRTWALSEANLLHWRKYLQYVVYLWFLGLFGASRSDSTPGDCSPLAPFVTPLDSKRWKVKSPMSPSQRVSGLWPEFNSSPVSRLVKDSFYSWSRHTEKLIEINKNSVQTHGIETQTHACVVVKNNPNILTYVWEEKYSSDTLTRRKITVWIYNQKNKKWQRTFHAQLSLLVFCLIVLAVDFY